MSAPGAPQDNGIFSGRNVYGQQKKNSPAPQDFNAGAAQADQANHPNQTNAFGTSTTYTTGPDGRPVQSTNFGGPLAGAAGSLGQQAANNFSKPFDLSGLPQLDSGQGARDQAINASFGQAQSRLDPQWNQRDDALRTRLLNQGLDPNSEASKNAEGQFGRDRNDAYGSAWNSAVGQGQQAQQQAFGQSAMAQQMALSNMLRQREQPLMDMQGMAGLTGQAGTGPSSQILPGMGMQQNANQQNWQNQNQIWSDLWGGVGQVGKTAAGAFTFGG